MTNESNRLPTGTQYMVDDLIPSLERYLHAGIPCGGFLMSVLCNDLMDACGRADSKNRLRLHDIVGYLWNHMPAQAWQSPSRVEAHLAKFKEQGSK